MSRVLTVASVESLRVSRPVECVAFVALGAATALVLQSLKTKVEGPAKQ